MIPEQKILALRIGMVTNPYVSYLLRDKNNVLTIDQASAKAVAFGVASLELDNHVAEYDLVITLVPFVHHAVIVRSATKSLASVFTVGYDSPAIRELEYQARAVDITLLNEAGVNPGVYHLYAIKAIGEVHEKGERYDAISPVLLALACIYREVLFVLQWPSYPWSI
ncbi:hypothetical protein LB504_006546 [Fusarium proliferatum]|nr:hypothetical protein LB504_006546 [Fusarium proliferatum]